MAPSMDGARRATGRQCMSLRSKACQAVVKETAATERTGEVVAALSVSEKDDLVCITSQGNTVKLRLSEVALLGKTAMGVRIVNITRPDLVVGVARVVKEDEDGVREAEEAARAAEAQGDARGEGGAEDEDGASPLPDDADDDGEENGAGSDEEEGAEPDGDSGGEEEDTDA